MPPIGLGLSATDARRCVSDYKEKWERKGCLNMYPISCVSVVMKVPDKECKISLIIFLKAVLFTNY
jgi:hypothetical protein